MNGLPMARIDAQVNLNQELFPKAGDHPHLPDAVLAAMHTLEAIISAHPGLHMIGAVVAFNPEMGKWAGGVMHHYKDEGLPYLMGAIQSGLDNLKKAQP